MSGESRKAFEQHFAGQMSFELDSNYPNATWYEERETMDTYAGWSARDAEIDALKEKFDAAVKAGTEVEHELILMTRERGALKARVEELEKVLKDKAEKDHRLDLLKRARRTKARRRKVRRPNWATL